MMNKNTHNHELLSTVKKLYGQLSMVATRIRLQSYRFLFEAKKSSGITALLNKQIDNLAASSDKEKVQPDQIVVKAQDSKQTYTKVDNESQQYKKIENISGMESEFSKYLKQKKSSSIIHPYMGDKLKKSTWEHVHSAIRLARQGDVAAAKLHADIAGHALEEAAHYLKDEDYSELVFEIEKCFIESKKDKE